jgi:protein-disulfide isomerase
MSEHPKPDLAVPVSAVDHVLGPSHPPVVIVEYGDFECPNCKQAVPALKHMVSRFEGTVRLVFRHFPLEEVHTHALHAALVADAAGSPACDPPRASSSMGDATRSRSDWARSPTKCRRAPALSGPRMAMATTDYRWKR